MKKINILIALGTLLLSSNLMAGSNYLNIGVADSDLNTDPANKQEVTVTVTSNHGETETVVLTESDVDSSRFTALVPVYKSNNESTSDDGKFNLNQNTNFKVVYNDKKHGDQGEKVLEADMEVEIAADPTEPPVVDPDSGGGCTYNPNSKNFDMTFLFIMTLGVLYPFRRRLLK